MINWNAILKDVEKQVAALAEKILKDYEKEAILDAKNFLENSKSSLVRWVSKLQKGEIDQDEFKSLVRGQLDVAELHAMKRAGLAEVKLDEFKNGVIQILISVALSMGGGMIG